MWIEDASASSILLILRRSTTMMDGRLLMINFSIEENEKLKRALTNAGMKNRTNEFFNAKLIKFFDINNGGSYESFYDYSLDISVSFRGYIAKHYATTPIYLYPYPNGNTMSYMVLINDDILTKLIELYNAAPSDIQLSCIDISIIALSAIMAVIDMEANTSQSFFSYVPRVPTVPYPYFGYNPNTPPTGNPISSYAPERNKFIPTYPDGAPAPFPIKTENKEKNDDNHTTGQAVIGQPIPTPTNSVDMLNIFGNSSSTTTVTRGIFGGIKELGEHFMEGLGIDTYKGFSYACKPEQRKCTKETVLEVEADGFDETKIDEFNKKLASISHSVADTVITAMKKGLINIDSMTTRYYEFTVTIPNYSYKKFITEWATTNKVKIHNPRKLAASFRYLIDNRTGNIIYHNIPRIVIIK
jgi:hypothetical protein